MSSDRQVWCHDAWLIPVLYLNRWLVPGTVAEAGKMIKPMSMI